MINLLVVEQLRNIVAKTADLVLPPRCAICGAKGGIPVQNFAGGLKELIEPSATVSQTTGSTLAICSLWAMEDSARHRIRRFKYSEFKVFARPLGTEWHNWCVG